MTVRLRRRGQDRAVAGRGRRVRPLRVRRRVPRALPADLHRVDADPDRVQAAGHATLLDLRSLHAANPPRPRPVSTPEQHARTSPVAASRQSALSATREPFVPPRQVLDQVDGRVLDPGTALAVKGVRPRSTVYVGPRLIVSESAGHATVIERLQQVAAGLGWVATVHHATTTGRRVEPTTYRAGRPGVVRLDLTVRDEKATHGARTAGCCSRTRGRSYGIEAMSARRARPHRAGAQHRGRTRSTAPAPSTSRARSTAEPGGADSLGGHLVLRRRRQRRPPADDVRRTGARAPARRRDRRVVDPSWPPWTPDAASTPGWSTSSSPDPASTATDRLRRRRRPTPRSGSTRSAPSTAASTRSPDTAPSSPA